MCSSPIQHVLLAAILAATSSAIGFGDSNDVTQTAGTVAPGKTAGGLVPVSGNSGFGNFGTPTLSAPASPTSVWAPPSGQSAGAVNQGWPQQQGGWSSGESTSANKQGWPSPNSYWSAPSGAQGWTQHGGWKSDPSTPPNGDQGLGTLGVDCSGSGESGWTLPNDQEAETLSVDCSGSADAATTPSSGDQGSGTLGVDCSGSSEGGWLSPSGDQGYVPLGVDCSGSTADGSATLLSLSGSNVVDGSHTAVGSASQTSSEIGGLSLEVPTDSSSSTEISQVSTSTGQGWSQAHQTSPTQSSTGAGISATTTESSVGADADKETSITPATSDSNISEQQQQTQEGSYTSTTQSDAIAYTSTWGAPVVAETGTNHSSTKPTFGKVTSKTGGCVIGTPTEYISEKYLDWVWEHRIGPNADLSKESNWNVMANKNWLMDHFVHNKGSMNYCVRWDTDNTLSRSVASEFKGVLERHFNAWNDWLVGYNCWPFTELKVNMVGFAARQASQFEWTDDSLGTIYEGNVDSDGVPQCPDECHRFYDNVNNVWSDTRSCKGDPFDVSLWLKEDIPYGFGYDWGQEVSLNNTMQNLYDRNIMFIGHEIGHGFGLPDFYGLEDKPATDFPNSIMMAYSSTTITPSDGWMLRRVLDRVRSRYKF
ncbi:unnamed protein product [Phytophthora fragariaefolia]|uniref:Unnamed protein product n=1 Tax=Phytophthora fragariaefolia TaxID=1490495 RepID=A0A9W6Y9Y7_9STRA|nr:unnamed protein product [Phytophthora fragariaefolia]